MVKKITKNYEFAMDPGCIRNNLTKVRDLRQILLQEKDKTNLNRILNVQAGEAYEIHGATAFFGLLAGNSYVKITGEFKNIEKARKYLENKVDLVLREVKEEE
tara:strand:+ start:2812 stop:3120 length:309 start_codon:yes stop_codon:yes gene_type:complete